MWVYLGEELGELRVARLVLGVVHAVVGQRLEAADRLLHAAPAQRAGFVG